MKYIRKYSSCPGCKSRLQDPVQKYYSVRLFIMTLCVISYNADIMAA